MKYKKRFSLALIVLIAVASLSLCFGAIQSSRSQSISMIPVDLKLKLADLCITSEVKPNRMVQIWTLAEIAYRNQESSPNKERFGLFRIGQMTVQQLKQSLDFNVIKVEDFCYSGWILVQTESYVMGGGWALMTIRTYKCQDTGNYITCIELNESGNNQCGPEFQ